MSGSVWQAWEPGDSQLMIRTEKGSGALSDGSVLSTPVCPRRVSPRLSPGRIDLVLLRCSDLVPQDFSFNISAFRASTHFIKGAFGCFGLFWFQIIRQTSHRLFSSDSRWFHFLSIKIYFVKTWNCLKRADPSGRELFYRTLWMEMSGCNCKTLQLTWCQNQTETCGMVL